MGQMPSPKAELFVSAIKERALQKLKVFAINKLKFIAAENVWGTVASGFTYKLPVTIIFEDEYKMMWKWHSDYPLKLSSKLIIIELRRRAWQIK